MNSKTHDFIASLIIIILLGVVVGLKIKYFGGFNG